jgi:hypothetical protein
MNAPGGGLVVEMAIPVASETGANVSTGEPVTAGVESAP